LVFYTLILQNNAWICNRFRENAVYRGGVMIGLRHRFLDHPASVGETYGEHCRHAGVFGARLIVGGCACLIHAVLPFVLTFTASDVVARLNEEMAARQRARPSAPIGK
jgi:hypothetical protein